MSPKLLILSLFSLALLGPLRAETEEAAPEAGTARDVILRADNAYNSKRYSEAISGYKKFLEDFGSAKEAEPFLPHVRHNLSAALMQEQKFGEAAEEISEALLRGESVKLRSFGTFNVRSKRERIGRNPKTGVEAKITPRRVLTFKASPVLVAHVNGDAIIPEED